MARPQTERGFVMIACDLFAALSVADWPKREWTVLAEILLQVYGTQKRREAHVDPRQVEHYTGLSSKNVYRALKSLKACGVIAETASGSYRFVKDFESWNYEAIEKTTGAPVRSRRLNDGDLRFALSANDRYGVIAPINKSKPVGIQPDTNGIQPDTDSGSKRYPTGYQICAPTVSNGILPTGQQTASVDASNGCEPTGYVRSLACGGAPASEEFEIRDLNTHRERVSVDNSVEDPEPFQAPIAVDSLTTGPGMGSPAALALEAWAKQLGFDRDHESYAHWARQTCDYAPADWIRAVLTHNVLGRSGAKRASIPYLASILKKWLADGACPHLKASNRPASDSEYTKAPAGFAEHIAGKKGKA